MADEPSALGTKLGAYEILGFIATGGMGTVYRAKNRVTEELRALKVMRTELASRPDFVKRFFREAKLAASLQHPHLVKVFEPGMDGETVFLPMELLEGETLADRIKRDGKIPEAEALGITRDVGSATAALHEKGILHRDLKPTNIFLAKEEDGKIVSKVIDLGAAKEVEASGEATATGITIGSPHYMSVEQASGAKDIDARTDQFSIAVVLYQMLTGARPYENDDSGHALAKLLAGAPFAKPRTVAPEISALTESAILRALSRERDKRFATLAAFLDALPKTGDAAAEDATRFEPIEERAAAKKAAIAATGTSSPTAVVKPDQKTSVVIIAVFTIFAIGVLALGYTKFFSAQAAPVATLAPESKAPPPIASVEPSATPLGLQVQTVDPESPTFVAKPVGLESVAPSASHKTTSAPTHHASTPTPKPSASAKPCTPTPGAPCL